MCSQYFFAVIRSQNAEMKGQDLATSALRMSPSTVATGSATDTVQPAFSSKMACEGLIAKKIA